MIWADRAAAFVALFWVPVMFLLPLGGFAPDQYVRQEYFQNWLNLVVIPLGAIWIFLRLVDLIGGGPSRRRGSVTYRRL